MVEDDMARRVAGAVAHVEGEVADAHMVAIVEPARRLERPAGNAVLHPILLQSVDPEVVFLVRPFDRHAELLGENSRTAAMIDMAVRKKDHLDRDASLLSRGLEPRQVAARVNEGRAHRRRAPDEGAILLQRRHRDDRRAQRRFAHFACSGAGVVIAGGSFFIDAATASACLITRSTLPPASLARFRSLQPRWISSAKS